MHLNHRTSALMAAGVISLAAVAHADESAAAVSSALSSTTISGYVDTSAQWNFGTGNDWLPRYAFGGSSKADGFNLNVVQLTVAKPLDEAEWASGYQVDLWLGPDANTLASQSNLATDSSDFAIRQAYVALRTPIGNGIDWKGGVFDTVIGYEVLASPNDPNFTRSWGFTIEPTTHTGIQAGYKINDVVSVTAAVADTVGPTINEKSWDQENPTAESYKTYMGSIALTAPDSWGWAKGSTLSAGVINGYSSSWQGTLQNWYAGATLATPVTGLKVGAAFDLLHIYNAPDTSDQKDTWALGGYASYQATEKLSLHLRADYIDDRADALSYDSDASSLGVSDFGTVRIFTATATAQYDLWKNVISRVEFRWDHSCSGQKLFGEGTTDIDGESTSVPDMKNAYMLLASIAYKF